MRFPHDRGISSHDRPAQAGGALVCSFFYSRNAYATDAVRVLILYCHKFPLISGCLPNLRDLLLPHHRTASTTVLGNIVPPIPTTYDLLFFRSSTLRTIARPSRVGEHTPVPSRAYSGPGTNGSLFRQQTIVLLRSGISTGQPPSPLLTALTTTARSASRASIIGEVL